MKKKSPARAFVIRWMIRSDLPEVLAIERDCFGSHAWGEEEFLTVHRQRNCIGMVAEYGEKIVGFMLYELKLRRLDLLNFAVHRSCRRMRVGTDMVDKLVGKLNSHRRTSIKVRVAERNIGAQMFFKFSGFRAVQVNRHVFANGDDLFVMQYDHDGHCAMDDFTANRLADKWDKAR